MGLLRELGFNGISLGVQDLDPTLQRNFQGSTTHGHCDLIELARDG